MIITYTKSCGIVCLAHLQGNATVDLCNPYDTASFVRCTGGKGYVIKCKPGLWVPASASLKPITTQAYDSDYSASCFAPWLDLQATG
jgi:hypothetical protein